MKKAYLSIIFLLCCSHILFAQYNTNQNKKWAWGFNAGLDFSSGSPVPFATSVTGTGASVIEGTASVADASGNLLFYSTGDSIWCRNGVSMPNGTALIPNYAYVEESFPGSYSCTQGSLIAPVIGNPNQYYVFTLEQEQDPSTGFAWSRLWYSIVDMTLNGGFGDVLPGQKYIPLDSNLAERMITIPGDNCNIWLLVHAKDLAQYRCYSITAAGISTTPVISNVGSFTGFNANIEGVLKSTPDRHKIVMANFSGSLIGAELSDFNPATGVVSNSNLIESVNGCYGGTFSPDNTKLYLWYQPSAAFDMRVAQYDISLPTIPAVIASKYDVVTGGSWYTDLKLGPDDKIYMNSMSMSSALDVINNPNVAGAGCNYVANAVPVPFSVSIGLPNTYNGLIAGVGGGDTTYAHIDTAACITPGTSITLTATAGSGYIWYDGATTMTHTVSATGSYWVAIALGCDTRIDTFIVTEAPIDTVYHIFDTSICSGGLLLTAIAPAGFTTYHWSDGSTLSTLNAPGAGTYWVTADEACGSRVVDTFHIGNITPDTLFTHHDTVACATVGSITLTAPAGFSSYFWFNSAITNSVAVSSTGNYWVIATQGCNIIVDTFKVNFTTPGISGMHTDITFCFPGNLLLQAPPGYTAYTWQDGSSGSTYTATAGGTYTVDASVACGDFLDTFNVIAAHTTLDLGPDTSICTAYYLTSPVTGPGISYLWQNGSTDSAILTDHNGQYYLTITQDGCVATDSINITIEHYAQNIPDVFICKGDPIAVTLQCDVPPGGTVMWNDGITTPSRVVTDSGTWWVYIKKDGCEILDTVRVVTGYCNCWSYIPSSFTPNGDGLNDKICPIIEPGCTIGGYQFSIYNRWGQCVFISNFRDGAWDGNWNGVPQDIGVYMYSLQFFAGVNSIPVYKKGDITLIR